MRARLKIALFSAMALGMRAWPTISVTNACRVGLSTTVASPSPKASAKTCQMRTAPVSASTPRIRASSPIAVWVIIRMRRLGYRSATAPPQGLASMGRNCSPVATPSAVPLPWVSWSTSQSWATRCIQVPLLEMTWPVANSR